MRNPLLNEFQLAWLPQGFFDDSKLPNLEGREGEEDTGAKANAWLWDSMTDLMFTRHTHTHTNTHTHKQTKNKTKQNKTNEQKRMKKDKIRRETQRKHKTRKKGLINTKQQRQNSLQTQEE